MSKQASNKETKDHISSDEDSGAKGDGGGATSGGPSGGGTGGAVTAKATTAVPTGTFAGAGIPMALKGQRRRKDGTVNKMSFDVDELEEGLYIQVEDEEDVEEVIEYEEVPDDEITPSQETTEVEKEGPKEDKKQKTGADDISGYKIRPDLSQKFRPGTVQTLIEAVIKEKLEGKEYSMEECESWSKQILEEVHDKVKSQNYKRYKLITQITIGERRGEGASSATRCLWDAEADCMATYTFLNDTIFCNGTVYGIYFY